MYFEVIPKSEKAEKAIYELVEASEQIRKVADWFKLLSRRKKKLLKEQQWTIICDKPLIAKCEIAFVKNYPLNSSVAIHSKASLLVKIYENFEERFQVKKKEIDIQMKDHDKHRKRLV